MCTTFAYALKNVNIFISNFLYDVPNIILTISFLGGNECMCLMKILDALCYFTTIKTQKTKDQWNSEHLIFMISVTIAILFFNGSEKWSYLLLKIVRGVVCLMNVKYLYICKKYFFFWDIYSLKIKRDHKKCFSRFNLFI